MSDFSSLLVADLGQKCRPVHLVDKKSFEGWVKKRPAEDRALLNAPALGMDVVAFCLIGLHHQADAELKTFAERTRGWPIVRDAWMVSGESDFLLHCVASDLGTFQTFVIEELASAPNVDTVRTALTIRRVKDEGLVAFPA